MSVLRLVLRRHCSPSRDKAPYTTPGTSRTRGDVHWPRPPLWPAPSPSTATRASRPGRRPSPAPVGRSDRGQSPGAAQGFAGPGDASRARLLRIAAKSCPVENIFPRASRCAGRRRRRRPGGNTRREKSSGLTAGVSMAAAVMCPPFTPSPDRSMGSSKSAKPPKVGRPWITTASRWCDRPPRVAACGKSEARVALSRGPGGRQTASEDRASPRRAAWPRRSLWTVGRWLSLF